MKNLVRIYIDEIIVRHGVPISIILDRESPFVTNRVVTSESLVTRLNISTIYHPHTDGKVNKLSAL